MRGSSVVAGAGIGFVALFALMVFVGLFVTKLMWGWVVPDLFPGAVQQGLVVASLTWWQAFKFSLFLGLILRGVSASRSKS